MTFQPGSTVRFPVEATVVRVTPMFLTVEVFGQTVKIEIDETVEEVTG